MEDARFLLRFEPKLIVAACNTASALALDELEAELPVPVVGVVKPGARAAVRLAEGAPVAVIGTEATIGSGAYTAEIRKLEATIEVVAQPCPLFVPLVEEGRDCDDPIVKLTVETYLAPLRQAGVHVVVLGCTHYPLLKDAITRFFGPAVGVVESGSETALVVQGVLERQDSLCPPERAGTLHCHVSDNPSRFRRIGSRFLDHDIEHVELVPPERYIASAIADAPRV